MTRLSAPAPLDADHDCTQFDSGEPVLDEWLQKRALANQLAGASRTFVVCDGKIVRAYYSLAAGAVLRAETPGRVRRNMPEPVPVAVLGRLAVDRSLQGQRIGSGVLRDAILRTLQASETIGIRALLVHALHEKARSFYERHGFSPSPIDPLMLMITMDEARRALTPPQPPR